MADNVQELTDTFIYQRLIDLMASDEGSKAAAIEGVTYAKPWYYYVGQVTVYDVCYPAVINGEHIGSLSIGYSMSNIQAAIQKKYSCLLFR